MAPSLLSNHFYIPSSILHHPRATYKPTIFAAKAPESSNSENSIPFRFDWGKLGGGAQSLVLVPTSLGLQRRKDPGTVFVAGATGLSGIRIAQTLIREGFTVRAGVPDLGAAQELARLAAQYRIFSTEESRRLNAVGSTFDDTEIIAKAIGNAAKVVVTIGPSENGPSAEVTAADALRVIQGAQLAEVGHVVIVYDDSLANYSTYNVLDGITSFFSNLFSKSQSLTLVEFLQKLVETDISYTLIKTKLTEDYSPESSYKLVVVSEGSVATANDYKVGRSQIASLVAQVFSNTAVAENKVVEVYTDPSALSKPIDELFRDIPEDSRRKVYAESIAKAKAEEEALRASEEAIKESKKLEEKEAESPTPNIAAEAQKRAEAAGAELLSKAKSINLKISWDDLSSRLQSAVAKTSEDSNSKVELATIRGQAKARSLPSLKAVVKGSKTPSPLRNRKVEKVKQVEVKEKRSALGGWFKQETIFVDDD